jgi:hypothetical protein
METLHAHGYMLRAIVSPKLVDLRASRKLIVPLNGSFFFEDGGLQSIRYSLMALDGSTQGCRLDIDSNRCAGRGYVLVHRPFFPPHCFSQVHP